MVGSWTLLEEASQLRSEALTTGTLPFHTGDLPLGSPKPSAHPFLPLPWHVAWGGRFGAGSHLGVTVVCFVALCDLPLTRGSPPILSIAGRHEAGGR